MSIDYQQNWEVYVAAWKASTVAEKKAKLAASAAPGCIYRDPLAVAEGHSAMTDYMMSFLQQVPGGHFVTTDFIAHHHRGMAKWNMVDGHGNIIGDGVSAMEFDAHGKIAQVSGFFKTPAA
jgi:predicted oxidoreductase